MAHSLVYYGNTTLSSVAERVDNIDESIISLIDEMSDIMVKENGIGLAAPQIDVGKKIIIVDPGDSRRSRIVLINPEIIEFSAKVEPYEEGCLSVPRIFTEVIRPSEILVKGVTSEGKEIEFEAAD
jgi:peptide deformylase